MTAAYSTARDEKMNKRWGAADYRPNENYYELDPEDYRDKDFPAAYEGKLIKSLWGGMLRLRPVTEYRVIFMRRQQKAIVTSLKAFFGQATRHSQSETFQRSMDDVVAILRDRRSVLSVNEVWYEDVIAQPQSAFDRLAREGWPIDSLKASMIPTKRLNRYGFEISEDAWKDEEPAHTYNPQGHYHA